jgi:hypothetical protein
MRKFIIKSILLVIVVLLLDIALITSLQYRYWDSRVPVIKSKIELKKGAKLSIVLGSSYALYGVNTRLISNSLYNYASTSQSYFEDFQILRKISSGSDIEYVILPLSYFSNYYFLSENPIQGEAIRIFDYEKAYNMKYAFSSTYFMNKIKFLEEIAVGICKMPQLNSGLDSFGNFKNDCSNITYNLDDSATVFKRHNTNSNFKYRHPFLDSIVNFCNRSSIKLYIIAFPFSRGYRREIEVNNPYFKEFLNDMKKFSVNRFSFIDCLNLIQNDEGSYFWNADHLSPCGRDLFSKYLSGVLKKDSIPI